MTNQKGSIRIELVAIIVIIVAALVYAVATNQSKEDKICLQKPTQARNVKTGETRDFPDSCIPDGWVTCPSAGCVETNINSEDETAGWRTHVNNNAGFTFKYPSTWLVDDQMAKYLEAGLNLFNSEDPYKGDLPKQGVMKAQFQYRTNTGAKSRGEFIQMYNQSIIGEPASPIVNVGSNISNTFGTEIVKVFFEEAGGKEGNGYLIPVAPDYSMLILVIVYNPDPAFEKVLFTFKFTE